MARSIEQPASEIVVEAGTYCLRFEQMSMRNPVPELSQEIMDMNRVVLMGNTTLGLLREIAAIKKRANARRAEEFRRATVRSINIGFHGDDVFNDYKHKVF